MILPPFCQWEHLALFQDRTFFMHAEEEDQKTLVAPFDSETAVSTIGSELQNVMFSLAEIRRSLRLLTARSESTIRFHYSSEEADRQRIRKGPSLPYTEDDSVTAFVSQIPQHWVYEIQRLQAAVNFLYHIAMRGEPRGFRPTQNFTPVVWTRIRQSSDIGDQLVDYELAELRWLCNHIAAQGLDKEHLFVAPNARDALLYVQGVEKELEVIRGQEYV